MLHVMGKLESINVRKVLWACDEVGASYTHEEWGVGTRSTSEPSFRQINPKGLVPVLVDGAFVLTESNSIVRYLAAKFERSDLLPVDPMARAKVDEMMDWQATEFNFAWRVAFQALVRRNPKAGSAEQIAQSLREWAAMVGLLDARLRKTDKYVCGDAFTIADIVIGLSVNRWYQSPIERADRPAVRGYLDRLIQRSAAARYLGGSTD